MSLFKRAFLLSLLLMILVLSGSAQTLIYAPGPTNMVGQYLRTAGGSTTWSYWVQTIYPWGRSQLAGPFQATSAPSALSAQDVVSVIWDPQPGAVAYDVLRNTTGTTPTGACNCAVAVNVTKSSLTDNGITAANYTVASITGLPVLVGAQTAIDTATISVTQLIGSATGPGLTQFNVLTGTPTAAAAYTLPLVTGLTGAMSPCIIGESWYIVMKNTSAGANTITVTTNTGWTLTGTMTVAQNASRPFLAKITSCASSTATLESLGTSASF